MQYCLLKQGVNMSFIKMVQDEIKLIEERDPAIHSKMEVFLYPSFKVMMHITFGQGGYPNGRLEKPVSRFIRERK